MVRIPNGRKHSRKRDSLHKTCNAKETCLSMRGKYGNSVFPVCPVLSKMIAEPAPQPKHTDSQTTGDPTLDCIRKVLPVLYWIVKLPISEEHLVRWAHHRGFFDRMIAPVAADLKMLPQFLESDFPTTAKGLWDKCGQFLLAAKRRQWFYPGFVYMMPPEDILRRLHPILLSDWQDKAFSYSRLSLEDRELLSMKATFPSQAVIIAREILEEIIAPAQKLDAELQDKQAIAKALEGLKHPEPLESNDVTVIDPSDWRTGKKGKSFNLLSDLIDDRRRDGVKLDTERHGTSQPNELCRRLGDKGYGSVAKAISIKKGVVTLAIPPGKIFLESKKK